MRAKGMTYDTGFLRDGDWSRPRFDPEHVARELRIIRDDLHCTAVRVSGGDAGQLELAASLAVDLGLEVWFSPYPLELTEDEMLALFADCAERAERLRTRGGEVVFVTGAELSLMARGFLPASSIQERLAGVFTRRELIAEAGARVNAFLRRAVARVRERFGGRVTYASIPIDRVDWSLFDIASVDLYRSAQISDAALTAGVRALAAQGKPVAITEFGAATFCGAGDRGAQGLDIVGADGRLDAVYERDEQGQADYIRELLEIFHAAGVDATFVFLFALHSHPHRPDGDPRDDLDLASYGIVKVYEDRNGVTYPDMMWEPKAAFTAVATFYGEA
jgi:hypothetical protein